MVKDTEKNVSTERKKDGDLVKSKAVVKFSIVPAPTKYAKLQCNTNLNMPPSNWLSHSRGACGLHQTTLQSSGFSSFRMAHMFPECVGEVDVVSDAKNIKHLLKLPYSPKSSISMMVHRIENTLLIDDFDIHKYLRRTTGDDWKWLRSFICENIINSFTEKDWHVFVRGKSREALQQKNLLTKFLYHSLRRDEQPEFDDDEEDDSFPAFRPLPIAGGPLLPEPNIEQDVPEPNANHAFNRNVVWTFEDIRMLVGTDMPIFGGGTRPCISLRLRDMSKPINVLTGIDYWLDNLMCNVPEVVMCYHLDGIVQKYELIKTEDLPNVENSQFSPRVVRNVAQNILSFLKSNATKSGHTYWLFKGRNDDVVKLYDLTTLCSTSGEEAKAAETASPTVDDCIQNNPFTVPVAMLLYTVARKMKNSGASKMNARMAGTIKTLLDNCIQLLPKEKYPQIVTSSHYMLSDLHLPVGIDPAAPIFPQDNADSDCDQSVYDDDEPDEPEQTVVTSPAIKRIQDTMAEYNADENRKQSRLVPPPLIASLEERCEIALRHVADGLSCLQYIDPEETPKPVPESKQQQINREADRPIVATPDIPIPLPYESIQKQDHSAQGTRSVPPAGFQTPTGAGKKRKTKKKQRRQSEPAGSCAADNDDDSPSSPRSLLLKGTSGIIESWNVHLKLLLLDKACLTYATLAEHVYAQESYGTCLRHIYTAIRCHLCVQKHISTGSSQRSCLFGRAGDCFFQFSKNWAIIHSYLDEFACEDDVDREIDGELAKDVSADPEVAHLAKPIENIEYLMCTSCHFYEMAIELASKDARSELCRRLGSVRNELGVKYMNWSQEEYDKYLAKEQSVSEESEQNETPPLSSSHSGELFKTLATKSFDSLQKGVTALTKAGDSVNLVFVLCNMGRFMRFRAHIQFPGESLNDVQMQKRFYAEAFSSYQRALGILVSRKGNPDLWDMVSWELSTATFTLAKQLQDYNTVDERQAIKEKEQEVVEMLQKSLKLCDNDTVGPRQVLYQYRSGMIHHRLASFYHHAFRTATEDQRRKTILQLTRMHYERSFNILSALNESKELLEIQIERIALQEFIAGHATTPSSQKFRILLQTIEIFRNCEMSLAHLSGLATRDILNADELKKILAILEQRLQTILRVLAVLALKQSPQESASLKAMYSATLRGGGGAGELELQQCARHLQQVVKRL